MASVATGYLLAGRALRPLRAITATARRVSSENLGERIALEGPDDELRELADTFDRMLARLDGAFASQRHFVANASHELRTPLAIMRTEVDVTLADPDATTDELRAMGEAVRETVDRCELLIAGLLMLARSEAATGRGEPVDVAALAGDCITDLRARAQEAHVEVHDQLEPAWTLRRAGPARADGRQPARQRHPPQRARRFSRGQHARPQRPRGAARPQRRRAHRSRPTPHSWSSRSAGCDRSVDGFGLGLSIVRSVAEAHGGSATVTAPAEGGLEVIVDLPALAAAPAAGPSPAPASAHPKLTLSGDSKAALTGS